MTERTAEREGVGRSIDEILAELNQLAERLAALPDDAFAERAEIRSRRTDLRAEADTTAKAALPDDPRALREQIARLQGRIEQIVGEHMNLGHASGDVGGGQGGGYEIMRINAAIDRAEGADALRAALQRLRARLEAVKDRERSSAS